MTSDKNYLHHLTLTGFIDYYLTYLQHMVQRIFCSALSCIALAGVVPGDGCSSRGSPRGWAAAGPGGLGSERCCVPAAASAFRGAGAGSSGRGAQVRLHSLYNHLARLYGSISFVCVQFLNPNVLLYQRAKPAPHTLVWFSHTNDRV